MKLTLPQVLFLLFFYALGSLTVQAYDTKEIDLKAQELPKELAKAGISERLGDTLDLGLSFLNEQGENVTLAQLFADGKPIILSLVYYSCPNLCNLHLNGLNEVLRKLQWTVGKEFKVVSVSFDSREGAPLSAEKKKSYLQAYGRAEGEKGWHFLTGTQQSIEKLAQTVGFSYHWSEETKEWAHSSAAILVTPQGKISRYLHGVYFEPQDMKLALLETSQGKIGTVIDKILFYCFHFDPKKNKYTLYAYNVMKAGATLTVLLMGLFLVPVWFRERHSSHKASEDCCSGHHHS